MTAVEEAIDYSDLEAKFHVEEEKDYDKYVMISGLPLITKEKQQKLETVIKAKLLKDVQVVGLFMPFDGETSQGVLFVEVESIQDAVKVAKAANGFALDKKHTLSAFTFNEVERLLSVSDTFEEPPAEEFKEKQNLNLWLQDSLARDQFAVVTEEDMAVIWSPFPQTEICCLRKKWTEGKSIFSPRGSYLATFHHQGIALWGSDEFVCVGRFPHAKVKNAFFSPCEGYLITVSDESVNGNKTFVWDLTVNKLLRGFKDESEWKWSFDDSFLAKLGKDCIFVYQVPLMTLLDKKPLVAEGVQEFTWSPTRNQIMYWTPEKGNNPFRVSLVELPSKMIIRTRNVFQVKDCNLIWHPSGSFVCAHLQRFNKKATFSSFEIFKVSQKDIPVEVLELTEDGKSFAWEPENDRFAYMVKTTILTYEITKNSALGKDIKLLKTLDRKGVDSLIWSPKGRFLLLACLKGSSGQLEFWNMNEFEMMSSTSDFHGSILQWDPSGRYVAAFTAPAYAIYDFKGALLEKKTVPQSKTFMWRPRPPCSLTEQVQKQIKKNLKTYSKVYDEMDLRRTNKAYIQLYEKRLEKLKTWKAQVSEWKAIYADQKDARREIRGCDSDCEEEEDVVDEWNEVVVEEISEIIE